MVMAKASTSRVDTVRDAGLCHGAAGLAHMYNRLFHATGEESFREAARRWIARTLDMAEWSAGGATYRFWLPADGVVTASEHAGLLNGTAGVALALLAATTPIEPMWDRMLLLSLAPITR